MDPHAVQFRGALGDLPNTVVDTNLQKRAHIQFALLVATLILIVAVAIQKLPALLFKQTKTPGVPVSHPPAPRRRRH